MSKTFINDSERERCFCLFWICLLWPLELYVCVSDCVYTSNWCSDDKWKEVGGPNTRDWDLDPIAHPLPRITGVLVFGFRIDFGFRAALEPLPITLIFIDICVIRELEVRFCTFSTEIINLALTAAAAGQLYIMRFLRLCLLIHNLPQATSENLGISPRVTFVTGGMRIPLCTEMEYSRGAAFGEG